MTLAILSGPAGADDAAYGEYLAGECVTCHAARPATGIPPIHGMDEASFTSLLQDYRSKARVHLVMNTIAARLGDAEIAALATYFATRTAP